MSSTPRPSRLVRALDRFPMPVGHDALEAYHGQFVGMATARAVGGDQPTATVTDDHRRLLRSRISEQHVHGLAAVARQVETRHGAASRSRRAAARTDSITGSTVRGITGSGQCPWTLTGAIRSLLAGTQALPRQAAPGTRQGRRAGCDDRPAWRLPPCASMAPAPTANADPRGGAGIGGSAAARAGGCQHGSERPDVRR
jgi:hypothetical protein